MNNVFCNSCGKDMDLEKEMIALLFYKGARDNINSAFYTIYQQRVQVCSDPQCMIKLLDSLKEEFQKEIDKDKTNAVGPTMKGSPGCAHGS